MIKKRANKANNIRRNRATTEKEDGVTPAQEAQHIVESAVKKPIKPKPSFLSFGEENEPEVITHKKTTGNQALTVT
jgi:hypothetical protein